jgi:prepilin-type N-terminal cleavage/methylation domain-containing protein
MVRLRLLQRGDTIVEVLVSLAIISLVLAGAYATSSRNTSLIQSSQEREQAQRLVEAQIENIRAHNGVTTTSPVCFAAGVQKPATDPLCSSQSATFSGASYAVSIVGPANSNGGIYTVQAKWDSPGMSAQSKLTMYYRLNP